MKVYGVTKGNQPHGAYLNKTKAHIMAQALGADQVSAFHLRAPSVELIVKAAERASSKFPKPWEGGSHLMRYIASAVKHADSQWKVTEDEEIEGLRLNKEDAAQAVKIAGALYRFFEQVGAENVLRIAGMEDVTRDQLVPKPWQEAADQIAEVEKVREPSPWIGKRVVKPGDNVEFRQEYQCVPPTPTPSPFFASGPQPHKIDPELVDRVMSYDDQVIAAPARPVKFEIPKEVRDAVTSLRERIPIHGYLAVSMLRSLATSRDTSVELKKETVVSILAAIQHLMNRLNVTEEHLLVVTLKELVRQNYPVIGMDGTAARTLLTHYDELLAKANGKYGAKQQGRG